LLTLLTTGVNRPDCKFMMTNGRPEVYQDETEENRNPPPIGGLASRLNPASSAAMRPAYQTPVGPFTRRAPSSISFIQTCSSDLSFR
jgi:hypothetical protein